MIHTSIFLIGYMGSGKTTLGKILAARLQWPFFDLDDLIREYSGLSISRIFREQGEMAFRQLESEVLQSVPLDSPFVMATGGGTPCHGENMAWMQTHGRVIYLQVSAATLSNRLWAARDGRPLLEPLNSKDRLQSHIVRHISEREPWYLMAHQIIEAEETDPDLIVSQLMQ